MTLRSCFLFNLLGLIYETLKVLLLVTLSENNCCSPPSLSNELWEAEGAEGGFGKICLQKSGQIAMCRCFFDLKLCASAAVSELRFFSSYHPRSIDSVRFEPRSAPGKGEFRRAI